MTNRQILANAPENATHWDGTAYFTFYKGMWREWVHHGKSSFVKTQTAGIDSLVRLLDIETIVKQQERIAKLKKEREESNEALTIAYMKGASDMKAENARLHQLLEKSKSVVNNVAHVGVDFGYGEYSLSKEDIQRARDLSKELEALSNDN